MGSKSGSFTEDIVADAAGVSVKVGVDYPGRSVYLPCATIIER